MLRNLVQAADNGLHPLHVPDPPSRPILAVPDPPGPSSPSPRISPRVRPRASTPGKNPRFVVGSSGVNSGASLGSTILALLQTSTQHRRPPGVDCCGCQPRRCGFPSWYFEGEWRPSQVACNTTPQPQCSQRRFVRSAAFRRVPCVLRDLGALCHESCVLPERLIGFEHAERMWLGSSLNLEMIVDIGSEIA